MIKSNKGKVYEVEYKTGNETAITHLKASSKDMALGIICERENLQVSDVVGIR